MRLLQWDELRSAFENADRKFRPDVMICVGTDTEEHDGETPCFDALSVDAFRECTYMAYVASSNSFHPTLFNYDKNSASGLEKLSEKAKNNSVPIALYSNCSPKHTKEGKRLYTENYCANVYSDEIDDDCGWRLKIRDFPYGGAAKLYSEGITLSCLAYDDENGKIIDLREYVSDGELVWAAPDGNWRIYQFYCERSSDVAVNILDYNESLEYLRKKYLRALPVLSSDENGNSEFYFSNLQYTGMNRNVWHPDFNEYFIREYGYDPSPYYLSLFTDTSDFSPAVRAQFVKLRSKLLEKGFMSAVADFCKGIDASAVLSQCEARMAESLWISGDPISARMKLMPAAQMNWAYLYGINSVKIASAAALYADGNSRVACEIFSGYEKLSGESVYRDTAIAFARGADKLIINADVLNSKMTHGDENDTFDIERYIKFVSRLQVLFSQGMNVSDIALIYPVDSLASQTYLFDKDDERGFEYPAIIQNADYPDLINSLCSCCGMDVTLLHPDVLSDRCYVEADKLKLRSSAGMREFSILMLPSSAMVSLKTLKIVKAFFDNGGKVIATGDLPKKAYEYSPCETHDDELTELLLAIFGREAFDTSVIKSFYTNSNDNGGKVIYIASDATSFDGTYTVSGTMLSEAIDSFEINSDVIIEKMPRVDTAGLFDLSLEEYVKTEFSPTAAIGGIFNYRHTRFDGFDVYFFANATNRDYDGTVLIKSDKFFEEWEPETGSIRQLNQHTVENNGDIYTKLELTLPSGKCTAFVSR